MGEAMTDTTSRRARLQPILVKVPEITLIFWVLKLLTTGMGEAMSDFLGQNSVPLAAAVGFFGLVLALWLQLRQPRYSPAYYWFAVMMVAVFGTMAADAIKDGAGIPYSVTTPAFALIVAAVFALWYRSEGTLSIHSIDTRRRECFYWAAVLGTFALGTAAGDLTAYQLGLGFWTSALLFGAIIAIPAVAWSRRVMNPNRRLLVRLHRHPAAWRLVRRRVQQADQRRPEPGRRNRQRDRARGVHRAGRVCLPQRARRHRPWRPGTGATTLRTSSWTSWRFSQLG